MKTRRPAPFAGVTLILIVLSAGFCARTEAAESFTVSAVPVNTSAGGTGTVNITVANIPFAGLLTVNCQYAGSVTFQEQNRLPVCGIGPPVAYTVAAGQTFTGVIGVKPWGTPEPATLRGNRRVTGGTSALALMLGGGLLLGFRVRLTGCRWMFWILIAGIGLPVFPGISACGGGGGPTSGVYPYTVTATLQSTSPAILSAAANTSVSITVM